ncbi:MAG: DUF4215 domain-containing protein [Sandaracinaceae bacterium]|nr:DUF4215 domain-containing protein [Sandaracinaceae bacterium]
MRASFQGLVLAFLCSLFAAPAFAEPTFVDPAFPALAYECIDCHVHPLGGGMCNLMPSTVHPRAPCLNPFGRAYREAGTYAAVATQDADGDGLANSTELNRVGSAGFPEGAEAAGCSMLQAASFAGIWLDCGTSRVQVRASFSSTPRNSYSYQFQCVLGASPAPVVSDTNWEDRCLDPNECAGNPCAPGTCTQIPLGPGWASPGYTCGCPPGYLQGAMGCQLVDACLAGTHTCHPAAECIDTPGSSAEFTCRCPHAGYVGDGRLAGTGCTNVNECVGAPCGADGVGGQDGSGCTELALTAWSPPGYTCACRAGHDFDGTRCILGNECTGGLADCSPFAVCMDPSPGPDDWTCTCPAGFLGGGYGANGCRDIDECATGAHDCSGAGVCVNLPGSFRCECPSGFVGDGRVCMDVDECADPILAGTCRANSRCQNLPGSYRCACDAGYRGDGLVACVDIDECATGGHDCPMGARCVNTPGRWTCECDDGFVGDGRTCTDVDECLDPDIRARCSTGSMCENLPGSWRCACAPGYEGDGFTCTDVDECARGTHTCHVGASCTNTVGAFSCACRDGYRGTGFDCVDIDECAERRHDCTAMERCVNQIGMPPICVCAAGFARNDAGDCVPACGDGRIGPGETCDDANTTPGDGCDEWCLVERGWTCWEPMGLESTCVRTCGDAFVDVNEDCDDGEANSDTAPNACRTDCSRASCGDGVVDTGEECDSGSGNADDLPDGCRTTCRRAYCGDGVLDTGERCDPGGRGPGEAPAGLCTDMCPEGGVGPVDPPTDGGCRASGGGAPAPWGVLGLVVLGVLRRRRARAR